MRRARKILLRTFRRVWVGIRAWCGDSDYEQYVRCTLKHGGARILSAEQFYVERINRRYSRPNRCC
jgi:uncharacterized short protein YbdD (DUF466 family)